MCRYSFGTGAQMLPIPELMPFRLTRQMRGALQPHDARELLRAPLALGLAALRSGSGVLEVSKNGTSCYHFCNRLNLWAHLCRAHAMQASKWRPAWQSRPASKFCCAVLVQARVMSQKCQDSGSAVGSLGGE